MSEHQATIEWTRGATEFTYDAYPRDHVWAFGGGTRISASAAPGYKGNPDLVDPEEAFVASLSSCHMLTFLALACKAKFVVDEYVDSATGTLGRTAEGRSAMTSVVLRPRITFAGDAPDAAQLADLHHRAHEYCFIANSVSTEVTVEQLDTAAAP